MPARLIHAGVPLGAKRETVAAYRALCGPICWHEHHRTLHTSDGKKLSTVSASTRSSGSSSGHILVVYFQGYVPSRPAQHTAQPTQPHSNASSSPPRLPHLSAILAAAAANSTAQYSFLVPSYRGYWTSTGSPSQAGIERDLAAVFAHLSTYGATTLVLWGQSIGCGIALTGWANEVRRGTGIRVAGVVLETPFVSVPSMLRVLYPQRWLPYRYLAGLLWSSWDVRAAAADLVARGARPRVLLVSAGRDEVVPEAETRDVERIMQGMGEVRGVVVRGALHAECGVRPAGRAAVVAFLKSFERADGI